MTEAEHMALHLQGLAHDHAHDEDRDHDHAHPHGHHHAYEKAVLNRLARSTGHLKSISGMVERGSDCAQILIQLAAVRAEINGICSAILKEHIDHCLVEAAVSGDTQSIQELENAIAALLKYG